MIQVSANHVSPRWHMQRQAFAIVEQGEFSSFRIGGDKEHGYYAMAPQYGCGRTHSTIAGAVRDLLQSNGCDTIRIEGEGS